MRKKDHVYRVVLTSKFGVTSSVFIKAKDRETAEKRALRRNPNTTINRAPFPQS